MSKQKHFYLIRGLTREALHWGKFTHHLQTQFPHQKITCIDIPGAGEHCSKASPFSIEEMVDKMRLEYKANQKAEDAILVAISLGGMIACAWIKKHPEDFKQAVLINTSFGGLSPFYERLKPKALLSLLKIFMMNDYAREAHILKLVSNNPEVFDETLELWNKICEERPVTFANALRQLCASAKFRLGNFKPTIPVYILASTKDRMVSVKCSRAIARLWKTPIIEHPTGGHELTADDPKWVAEKIKSLVVD